MPEIRVALIGIGNCASAAVQGVHHYRSAEKEIGALGLKNLLIGDYHPKDIEFVAAFDIDERKVGRDLSQAIFSQPNNAPKIADVPDLGVEVLRGPVLDGVGEYLKNVIRISRSREVDVAQRLKESKADMVINLLPSGAVKASRWYAERASEARCAFINATPTLIASDAAWGRRFRDAKIPVVGDDLVDQVGATILHKLLLKALADQGVRIAETYQLDVGGGTESLDTLER